MTTPQKIATACELAALLLLLIGKLNESKIIGFENKIAEVIRKKWL